ncbi:MAG: 30S ribosomal protein S16 [Gemmatimonadetes bacterium RIFCSPLOWO2_02_FULL_71_11]|nr:MAG: 30S ribosomal protein S16 [Gemmatimonadetes bacterium RIFCSPLOWO2_02_FULL_71_11]
MAVKIRLRKTGRKRQPSYRIVVADSESPRDGRFIELLGHYFPRAKDKEFDVDVEKARAWLSKGATPSETVASILKKAGCFAVDLPKPPVT